jgi:hypothetical protein
MKFIFNLPTNQTHDKITMTQHIDASSDALANIIESTYDVGMSTLEPRGQLALKLFGVCMVLFLFLDGFYAVLNSIVMCLLIGVIKKS